MARLFVLVIEAITSYFLRFLDSSMPQVLIPLQSSHSAEAKPTNKQQKTYTLLLLSGLL